MSHEPGVPKSNLQEHGNSPADCLALVPKEEFPKSKRQEPVGSTYDRLILLLKKIFHLRTQNKIATPFIKIIYKTDIMKKCNSLHRKYVDINKNIWISQRNADFLLNRNMTPVTSLI